MTKQPSSQFLEEEQVLEACRYGKRCVITALGLSMSIEKTAEGGLLIYVQTWDPQNIGQGICHGHEIKIFGAQCYTEHNNLLTQLPGKIAAPRSRSTGQRAASKGRGSSDGKK